MADGLQDAQASVNSPDHGPATYTLTYSNTGPALATGVVITDIMPVGMMVQSIDMQGVANGKAASTSADVSQRHFVWQVKDLVPNERRVIIIRAQLNPSIAATTVLTNTAEIACSLDDNPENNTSQAALIVNLNEVYLPLVLKTQPRVVGPDLVVENLIATTRSVQVVIRNQGNAPVEDEFWVDVYIDPHTVPTAVNQAWPSLADQGLVWGVTADALPLLVPGGALTLTMSDAAYDDYYWPSRSQVSWPLGTDTPIYAHYKHFESDSAAKPAASL